MQLVYSTNTLLSLARLPFHFWNMLNPREDVRNNPGTSIISWIVAKSLTLESTHLPKDLSDNMKKILAFSTQREKICSQLKRRITTMSTVLENYSDDQKLWHLVVQANLTLDRIKTKITEIMIHMTSADSSDFTVNDELISVKNELDHLKMLLNDEGILLDWED